MSIAPPQQLTTRDADLVRPGTQADLAALLRAGGRILQRGQTLHIRELDTATPVTAPWVLLSFGPSRQRILVLLLPDDASEERRGRRVVHHLP